MAGKGTVKIGHIRSLHKHLGEILDGFDGKVAAADAENRNNAAPATGRKPEGGAPNPAAHDAAPTRSMNDAFPAMRGRDPGLSADDLNRLNRR